MAWFRVDDNFYDHPKVDELSLEAVGIWLLCGTYVAKQLTDGFIPDRRITRLGGNDDLVQELVEAELWDPVDGGYMFRNWMDYQPTKDAVEAKREADRERQRKKRRNDKGQYVSSTASHSVTPTRLAAESHHPSPAQPSPAPNAKSTAGAASQTDAANAAFDDWYSKYPKKVGKGQARTAFKTALKKTDLETLKAGLANYNKTVEGKEREFIANPATWLNGERWEDDYTTQNSGESSWDKLMNWNKQN